jgi:hypothetical protein
MHHGADWHTHNFGRGTATVHLLSHPMGTVLRFDQRLVKQGRQIVGVLVRAKDNVAPLSAVSAIRAAPRHKLLPAKTDATTPTITGLRRNLDAVDEHTQLYRSMAFCECPLLFCYLFASSLSRLGGAAAR